jgi:hypothetical protein
VKIRPEKARGFRESRALLIYRFADCQRETINQQGFS